MYTSFQDFQQKLHRICILQYVHPSEAKIISKPHKNAKSDAAYFRTKKSVLLKVKNEAAG